MGRVGKHERLHGHILHLGPRHPLRQGHLVLGILHQEGTYHRQVSIGAHATLIVGHGVLATEAAAHLAYAVRSLAGLEVVLHP